MNKQKNSKVVAVQADINKPMKNQEMHTFLFTNYFTKFNYYIDVYLLFNLNFFKNDL